MGDVTLILDPSVSVVVTTFNHQLYIAETIRSVLAQTYKNREIVVVDDGSTDQTADVLASFGDAIRSIRQANEGVAGSRNRGIREAKGVLLAFLDGDDRWHPDKLRRQVDAYQQFPDSGLIACDARSFDGENVTRNGLLVLSGLTCADSDDAVVSCECFERLVRGNLISTTTQIMIPRHVLDDVGLSDTSFPVASDYDLYLRIARHYPFTFVREALADYRYLASSASGPESVRLFRWTTDVLGVLRKHARLMPASSRALAVETLTRKTRFIARLAYYRGCEGHRKWALKYLWQLLLKSRGDPVVAVYMSALLAPGWFHAIVAPFLGRAFRRME